MEHLQWTSAQLRLHNLTVPLAVGHLGSHGEGELLAWFGCDIIDRGLRHFLLQHKLETGREWYWQGHAKQTLQTTRRYLSGEAHRETLTLAIFAAWSMYREHPHSMLEALWRTALGPFSQDSIHHVERASSHRNFGIYTSASDGGLGSQQVITEEWKRSRLIYLTDVWATCGARSAWLLFEDLCPLPPPEEAALLLTDEALRR